MRLLLLLLLLTAACVEAAPRRQRTSPKPAAAMPAPRPLPAASMRSGQAEEVVASRIYPSSGRVRMCIRYSYNGTTPLSVRFEFAGTTEVLQLGARSSGFLCRLLGKVGDPREGMEMRIVLVDQLSAELKMELSAWDANP